MKYNSNLSKPGINVFVSNKEAVTAINETSHSISWLEDRSYRNFGLWSSSSSEEFSWVLCAPVQLTEWNK